MTYSQPPAGLIPGYMTEVGHYYKMPPVGLTGARGRIGERVIENYTIRCGHPGCWFVGNAATEADAQGMLNSHACPTLPARNELPTGLSTLEKLWDELDAVMVAINEQTNYPIAGRNLDHMAVRSYALGLCFSLSMMTHPHFRTVNDVLAEAQRRYKMRKGELPYSPTPTYRNNPLPAAQQSPAGERAPYHGETKPASAATPTRRTAQRGITKAQAAAAARVDLSSVDPDKRQRIINAVTLMGMTHQEVGELFDVTTETVKVLVDGTAS